MPSSLRTPPIAPLPWLIRYGGGSLAVLAGADTRLIGPVPRLPRGMWSLPLPPTMRRWRVPGSPLIRRLVFVTSPELVRQVFSGSPSQLYFGYENPIGKVTGARSLFSLDGEEHLEQRRIILPPLHGRRMQAYEGIAEEETLGEIATWPTGVPHPTTEGFMRITLNIILRAVFGVREGPMMDLMRAKTPRAVVLGSRIAAFDPLARDLGPRSPGRQFRELIREFEWGVNALVDEARRDPNLEQRADVLALLSRATHEGDGSLLSDQEIADQLKAIVAAGHETTANTLSWAVERLSRHPEVLRRLVEEADSGGRDLRIATIHEVQRTRPVIPGTARFAVKPFELGGYVLPPGTVIVIPTPFLHQDPEVYPHPERFDPDRFLGRRPDPNSWVPFGGGVRRCPGASFAHMEMDVVLRTLLRELRIEPTTRRGERMRWRGIAFAPSAGGKIVVQRRRAQEGAASPDPGVSVPAAA